MSVRGVWTIQGPSDNVSCAKKASWFSRLLRIDSGKTIIPPQLSNFPYTNLSCLSGERIMVVSGFSLPGHIPLTTNEYTVMSTSTRLVKRPQHIELNIQHKLIYFHVNCQQHTLPKWARKYLMSKIVPRECHSWQTMSLRYLWQTKDK